MGQGEQVQVTSLPARLSIRLGEPQRCNAPWAGVVSGPHSGSRGSTLPKRTGRGSEPGLALPTREGAGSLQLPGEEGDRSQDVWQWMLETERQSKPKPHR